MNVSAFGKLIIDYHEKHGRHDLPWRKTKDPYKILVSEMMLQQTQVSRVIPKYKSWMKRFPSMRALAKASVRDVLMEWQGLGYNRRALYLKKTAEEGLLPVDFHELQKLPGIGQSTAGAIMAFAYDVPVVFIETNIRSVFIHHFFPKSRKVSDKKILPIIEKTLDRKNPRKWYYALMDYGVFLKSTHPNPSRKSRHHAKQTPFKGSTRELRANILRKIISKARTEKDICAALPDISAARIRKAVEGLERDGFLKRLRGNVLKIRT
jgi:A/G-specific adenine glycosylase